MRHDEQCILSSLPGGAQYTDSNQSTGSLPALENPTSCAWAAARPPPKPRCGLLLGGTRREPGRTCAPCSKATPKPTGAKTRSSTWGIGEACLRDRPTEDGHPEGPPAPMDASVVLQVKPSVVHLDPTGIVRNPCRHIPLSQEPWVLRAISVLGCRRSEAGFRLLAAVALSFCLGICEPFLRSRPPHGVIWPTPGHSPVWPRNRGTKLYAAIVAWTRAHGRYARLRRLMALAIVDGAGWWRDAMRCARRGRSWCQAGLTLVVLTPRVTHLGAMSLPVKCGCTGKADGGNATLTGAGLPRIHVRACGAAARYDVSFHGAQGSARPRGEGAATLQHQRSFSQDGMDQSASRGYAEGAAPPVSGQLPHQRCRSGGNCWDLKDPMALAEPGSFCLHAVNWLKPTCATTR